MGVETVGDLVAELIAPYRKDMPKELNDALEKITANTRDQELIDLVGMRFKAPSVLVQRHWQACVMLANNLCALRANIHTGKDQQYILGRILGDIVTFHRCIASAYAIEAKTFPENNERWVRQ